MAKNQCSYTINGNSKSMEEMIMSSPMKNLFHSKNNFCEYAILIFWELLYEEFAMKKTRAELLLHIAKKELDKNVNDLRVDIEDKMMILKKEGFDALIKNVNFKPHDINIK